MTRLIKDPDCGYHLGQRAGSFGSHTVGHDGSTVECTWILETPNKTTDPYYWGMNFIEHVAFLYILELDMELSGCPDTNLQVS